MTFQKGDLVQAKPSAISLAWESVYLVVGPASENVFFDGEWLKFMSVSTGETFDNPVSLFNLIARAKK